MDDTDTALLGRLENVLQGLSRSQWLIFCRNNDVATCSRDSFVAHARLHPTELMRWTAAALQLNTNGAGNAPTRSKQQLVDFHSSEGAVLCAVTGVTQETNQRPSLEEVLRCSATADTCFRFLGIKDFASLRLSSLSCLTAVLAHARPLCSAEITDVRKWNVCFPTATLATVKLSHVWPSDFMWLRGVRTLFLGPNCGSWEHFSEASICAALACLTGLEELTMHYWPRVTAKYFQQLRCLRKLDISECEVVPDDAFTHLGGLKSLTMNNCKSPTNAALANLRALTHLCMYGCTNITDDGLRHLTDIRVLNITGCNLITGTCFEQLAELTVLRMPHCNGISDDCFRHLLSLKVLEAGSCSNLSDAAFEHLNSRIPTCEAPSTLESLSITSCRQSQLTGSFIARLGQLKEFNIAGCSDSIILAALARYHDDTKLLANIMTQITDDHMFNPVGLAALRVLVGVIECNSAHDDILRRCCACLQRVEHMPLAIIEGSNLIPVVITICLDIDLQPSVTLGLTRLLTRVIRKKKCFEIAIQARVFDMILKHLPMVATGNCAFPVFELLLLLLSDASTADAFSNAGGCQVIIQLFQSCIPIDAFANEFSKIHHTLELLVRSNQGRALMEHGVVPILSNEVFEAEGRIRQYEALELLAQLPVDLWTELTRHADAEAVLAILSRERWTSRLYKFATQFVLQTCAMPVDAPARLLIVERKKDYFVWMLGCPSFLPILRNICQLLSGFESDPDVQTDVWLNGLDSILTVMEDDLYSDDVPFLLGVLARCVRISPTGKHLPEGKVIWKILEKFRHDATIVADCLALLALSHSYYEAERRNLLVQIIIAHVSNENVMVSLPTLLCNYIPSTSSGGDLHWGCLIDVDPPHEPESEPFLPVAVLLQALEIHAHTPTVVAATLRLLFKLAIRHGCAHTLPWATIMSACDAYPGNDELRVAGAAILALKVASCHGRLDTGISADIFILSALKSEYCSATAMAAGVAMLQCFLDRGKHMDADFRTTAIDLLCFALQKDAPSERNLVKKAALVLAQLIVDSESCRLAVTHGALKFLLAEIHVIVGNKLFANLQVIAWSACLLAYASIMKHDPTLVLTMEVASQIKTTWRIILVKEEHCRYATESIAILATTSEATLQTLVACGFAGVLLDTWAAYNTPHIAVNVCTAMRAMCKVDRCHAQFIQLGVLSLLLDAVDNFIALHSLQGHVLLAIESALGALVVNVSDTHQVSQLRGVPRLLTAMTRQVYPSEVERRHAMVFCFTCMLCSLITEPANFSQFQEAAGCDVLLSMWKMHGAHADVQENKDTLTAFSEVQRLLASLKERPDDSSHRVGILESIKLVRKRLCEA